MSEHRDSYLLPCSCGKSIVIQPRHAGETVRCQCGRENTVPRMGEIRRLQPAETLQTAAASPWGTSHRLLVGGLVLVAIAAILAAVLLWYPHYVFGRYIEYRVHGDQQLILAKRPWDAIQFFRQYLEPGIELPRDRDFQTWREMYGFGMAVAGTAAAAGALMIGFGVAGLTRKTDAPKAGIAGKTAVG